jgi:hypothetical protein
MPLKCVICVQYKCVICIPSIHLMERVRVRHYVESNRERSNLLNHLIFIRNCSENRGEIPV